MGQFRRHYASAPASASAGLPGPAILGAAASASAPPCAPLLGCVLPLRDSQLLQRRWNPIIGWWRCARGTPGNSCGTPAALSRHSLPAIVTASRADPPVLVRLPPRSLRRGKCFFPGGRAVNFADPASPHNSTLITGSWGVGRSLSAAGGDAVLVRYNLTDDPGAVAQSRGAALITGE